MRAEDIDTRFKERASLAVRKYPRSRDEKSRHFCGYHLHWLTSLETSRHFRKIALRLGIFLAMFRECLCVVARQLAPKCRDFSNVAKLASRCKWPYTFCPYLVCVSVCACKPYQTGDMIWHPTFMIFHWCQWKWQTHFALLQEMSLLSLASFCQSRAE